MGLTLHNWYTAADAVDGFGSGEHSELFCDGQFVVLPSVVLCFVTVGNTPDVSHVSAPSEVVWRPKPDPVPSTKEWLPEKVREVFDRSGQQVRRIRNHHIFLRTPADSDFVYAGEAHLGSYGGAPITNGVAGLAADFSLNHRLPREVWLHMGGYPGWLVEVNDDETHRIAEGDIPEFRRLVNKLFSQEFSHMCMTRYEDSLTVHTNARRGWLMYLRSSGNICLSARDRNYDGPPESEEMFQCVCGIGLEFPTKQTLPPELAGRAAVELFETGQLPGCVDWESE
jgi:hypothetical protein